MPNGTIPCNNKGQQVYIIDNMDPTYKGKKINTLKDSHYMTVEQIKSWNGKMQWDKGTSFDISANGQATVKFKAIEDGKYYTLEDIRNGSVSSDKKFVKMKIKLLKDLVAPDGSTVLTYSYETTADLSNAVPGEKKYANEVTVDQKVLTATYSYGHTVSKTAEKLDNNEIKWTITVNANKMNIAGGVLKDDMFKAITDLTKFTISPDDKQSYKIIKETTNGKETIKEIQFNSVKDKDGNDTYKNTNTYTITYYTVAPANTQETTTKVIEAGSTTIEGLDDNTDYYLYEIKAPIHYNKLKAPVKFKIAAEYNDAGDDLRENYPIVIIGTGDPSTTLKADVINESGSNLPSTGGIGTTIFYVVGGILMVGAAVLLITKRRAEN